MPLIRLKEILIKCRSRTVVVVTVMLLLFAFRYLFWRIHNKIRKYPNGPLGLVFLGCLLEFGIKPRKFLVDIVNKYGAITYVPLLASNNIFISDCKVLRELYQKQKIWDTIPYGLRAVPPFPLLNGAEWQRRRKYATETIFTLSNSSFILSNVKQCIDDYIEQDIIKNYIETNKIWYASEYIHYITFTIVWCGVFNKILPFNDPLINKYCKLTNEFAEKGSIVFLFDLISNFTITLPAFIKWQLTGKTIQNMDDIVLQWMNNNGFIIDVEKNVFKKIEIQNRQSMVYTDFLIEKFKNKEISLKEIVSDIQTVILGAIDTTSTSAEYGFLLLAKFPNIQEMVYNELISVMDNNNLKEFDFKILNELHIFRAFVHELLRISSVLPMGLPHLTTKNHTLNINGKKIVIPKYCILHENVYYMHKFLDWNDKNKSLKIENNEIHLEYWLENKKFKMNENFVSFGVGKRNCVGQSFAIKVLYAIYGLFITKYKFVAPNNDPNSINIKQSWGMILHFESKIGIHVEKR